jgi:hypothetical protein
MDIIKLARDEAHKRFEKSFSNNNQNQQSINPNIRAAIYLTVAKTGNQEAFGQLKSVISLNIQVFKRNYSSQMVLINLIKIFSILTLS